MIILQFESTRFNPIGYNRLTLYITDRLQQITKWFLQIKETKEISVQSYPFSNRQQFWQLYEKVIKTNKYKKIFKIWLRYNDK